MSDAMFLYKKIASDISSLFNYYSWITVSVTVNEVLIFLDPRHSDPGIEGE